MKTFVYISMGFLMKHPFTYRQCHTYVLASFFHTVKEYDRIWQSFMTKFWHSVKGTEFFPIFQKRGIFDSISDFFPNNKRYFFQKRRCKNLSKNSNCAWPTGKLFRSSNPIYVENLKAKIAIRVFNAQFEFFQKICSTSFSIASWSSSSSDCCSAARLFMILSGA